jgi:signal transduction histidine kinase
VAASRAQNDLGVVPRRLGDTEVVRAVLGSLTLVLGVLWGTGGALALLWALTGVLGDGWPPGVAGVGITAMLIGTTLTLLRRTVLPLRVRAAFTLLGSVAIVLILFWSGPTSTGTPGILFVYVAVYACVALGRLAAPVLVVSIAAHTALLVAVDAPVIPGQLTMIWGTALVAGVVVGAAVRRADEAASAREEARRQLERSDAAKTAFLRAVGHDLTTPAAVIAGIAETIAARGPQLPEAQREQLLERLAANAARLRDDIAALLDLGELADGHVELTRTPQDVRELVYRAAARAGLTDAEVQLGVIEVDEVVVDAAKVEHALANLLGNAAKYALRTEPILVTARRDGPCDLLQVHDDGPGVPDDRLEAIFEPFVRATTEDVGRGSGVGLSVVRAFARLHGGDAWAELRPGGGLTTTFAIRTEVTPPGSHAAPTP